MQHNWITQLEPIILEFRDGEEPLDSDEVERLIDILRAKINLHEGNITEEEYECEMERGHTSDMIGDFLVLWGCTDDEIAHYDGAELDDSFPEMVINRGYVWLPKYEKWVNKNARVNEEGETILNYLIKEAQNDSL